MPDYRVRFESLIVRNADSPEHAEKTARAMVAEDELVATIEKVESS